MDSIASTHMLAMAGGDWAKAQHVPARLWPATRPCHHPHLLGAEGCVQLLKCRSWSPDPETDFF